MEKWYSCYWVQFEALLKNWKENSNILFTKHDNERARRIGFKFYKNQTKSENYEICQDIMISYMEAVIKNWAGFVKVVTYVAYKTKHLRRSSIDMRSIR